MSPEAAAATPAARLGALLTPTDRLSVSPAGELMIEARSAPALLREFGSPLYVVAEDTLRRNYRRIRDAFAAQWPREVRILYAIKANNAYAIRAILHQEGAGGECFGESELYATFMGGADPDQVVLNGSNKTVAELDRAIDLGVRINIDGVDEIGFIAEIAARRGRLAKVNLRLKVAPDEFRRLGSDYFGLETGLADYLRDEKWGFSVAAAAVLIERLQALPQVALEGFHLHLGRLSRAPAAYAAGAAALAEAVVELHRRTGFAPRLLDIGGGWTRERDPEARLLSLNPHGIEAYAAAACAALLAVFRRHDLPIPELWLEPGRYIIGNAVVLLARVGEIKRDLDRIWVHVDASTNNLMRIDTAGSTHHVIAAEGMGRPDAEQVFVVGPTCLVSVLGTAVPVPALSRGEAVAILDAGMYAETTANQFNGVPRPATVLVNGERAEIIKERETVQDVFAKHRIPERLRAARPGQNTAG